MDTLDELLRQASTLKRPLDLLRRFKDSPQVKAYIEETRRQRDAVEAMSRKYDLQMKKIAALIEADDFRFKDDPVLRHCVTEYSALASTVSRIPAGENWLANLSNQDFFPLPDVADWWTLSVSRKLWQLKEHFQPCHAAAISMQHYAEQALGRISDIEYRHPSPVIKFRRGFEPEAPRRSNPAQADTDE
jgi:hypothetical protein